MNQKKSKKVLIILIILILILILIVIAGGAIAYFTTDIFKSDKELFFKYISQVIDNEKGLIDKDIIQYVEKRSNTPYNNESKISFNFSDGKNDELYKSINNFNIELSGQVDSANSKISQEVSLNYSENVNLPFNFRQVENTIGIQSKLLGSKFIAIDTNKLDNSADNLEMVEDATEYFGKIENAKKVELNEEQINNILNKYVEIVNHQLGQEKFSKVKEDNLTGYKLSLTGEELSNLVIQLLETLKNDQETLDKLNEYLKIQSNSSKLTASYIDSMIKNIQNSNDLNNKNIEIIVYKDKGIFNKLSVKVDETVVSIEKNYGASQKDIKVNIINEGIQIINLGIKLDGFQSMQNIKENYEIELNIPQSQNYDSGEDEILDDINSTSSMTNSDKLTIKYIVNNDINFTDISTIEALTDQNSLILSNYDSEQVNEFLNKVGERIQQINKEQMEELGLEEEQNPLLQCLAINFANYTNAFKNSGNVLGRDASDISEDNVQKFNKKFETYEGTNLSGQTTKGLLSTISLNNEDDENYKIKEINFNGEEYDTTEQNIVFIKEDIDLSKNYKVEFEKDEDSGIIFRVIINVK